MLRVAVTQPNYLPWLGYLAVADTVDVFVSLDAVQLSRRSFVVRNRVKTGPSATSWISESIESCPRETPLNEARIAPDLDWSNRHLDLIAHAYRRAPYLNDYLPELRRLVSARVDRCVARFNEHILRGIYEILGVEKEIVVSSTLVNTLHGSAQDKIMTILEALGEKEIAFYNAVGGVDAGLYSGSDFEARGWQLHRQDYQHPTYVQQHGEFVPYLSVVDLLLNEGPRSLAVLRTGQRWARVT